MEAHNLGVGVRMLIDLEAFPDNILNPPPWRIEYIVDEDEDSCPAKILPLARTIGLDKLGLPNLAIRFAPPNIASAILDRIGVFLVFEKKIPSKDDVLRFIGLDFAILPEVIENNPILIVSWERDPGKATKRKNEQFNTACAELGINFRI